MTEENNVTKVTSGLEGHMRQFDLILKSLRNRR